MAFATQHNGGRSQTNFNFLQTGGEYPFINVLKTAQAWSHVDNNGAPLPTDLDANGYLSNAAVVASHGGIKTRFYVPTQAARPGNYVIKWDGNGTIFIGFSQTAVSGSLTSSTGSGRYVLTPGTDVFDMGISGVGAPYITNIRVCHASDEAAMDAGEVFGTKFKARLAEANFGVYRFLNWQNGNTSNVTNYASLKPATYVFYEGSEFRGGIYAGTATLSGVTYSVAAPSKNVDGTSWAGLIDKATVSLQFATAFPSRVATFTNASNNIAVTAHGLAVNNTLRFNTDPDSGGTMPTNFAPDTLYFVVNVPDANTIRVSATQGGTAITAGSAQSGTLWCSAVLYLNVGATGAKEMLGSYSLVLSKGGNSYPLTNRLATLVYDLTLDKWIKWGGDTAIGDTGLYNAVPPTICFQLCAEMGAHPWFVSYHMGMDPLTDVMPTIATYCRDNAPPWMKPIYEGPNELWNTQFYHTSYALNKAVAYGWSGGYSSWYGKIMSVLGQAISTVYSANRARYDVVCGVRTAAGQGNGVSEMDQRLLSAEYVAQVAAAQSPYLKSPAYNWVTAVASATYWNSTYYGTATETAMATEYTTASSARKTEIANNYADGCLTLGSRHDTPPALVAIFANWKAWALSMATPVRQMYAYEGCYTPDYSGNTAIDTLRFAGKSAANMGGYLTSVYYSFASLSDATFTAMYPSNFVLGDFTSPGFYAGGQSSGAWPVFLGDIYAAGSTSWDAICRYNAIARAANIRLRNHG